MRRKNRVKKIIQSFICVGLVPIIYFIAYFTLPYMNSVVTDVTTISAGLNFLEGGRCIIMDESNYDADTTFIDTQDTPFVEYEKEASSTISSVEEKPATPSSVVKPASAGTIKKQTFKASASRLYIPLQNGYIKNCTTISAEKIAQTIKLKPKFKISTDKSPQVLIMHTHTTESFQPDNDEWFEKGSSSRTTDSAKNIVSVGDEIEKQLKSAGIGVIHDTTLHDYPSYNGSYERSAKTVKKILKDNPSIKVVLDVHRDAIQPNADTMISPVTTINGKSCAQVMIISGCDDGKMNMPNYMENLKFGSALQSCIEKDYPTLTRPLLFDYRKYNQDLTTGSILLEMGGHANTLEEAIYSGELVGKSLAKTLLTLK